jgi:hypothetical protein
MTLDKNPLGKTSKRDVYIWISSSNVYKNEINTKELVIVDSSSQS